MTGRKSTRTRFRLNRRLTLEGRQRSPDLAGGYVETWVGLGEVWASVQMLGGRLRSGGDAALALNRVKITIRATPEGDQARPRPDQRFRDGGRWFLIDAVSEADPDGRFLTCFAREVTVQ